MRDERGAPVPQTSKCAVQWCAALRHVKIVGVTTVKPQAGDSRKGWQSKCTAGFQTGCIADFQIRMPSAKPTRSELPRPAGLETRDTADLEVCGTGACRARPCEDCRGHHHQTASWRSTEGMAIEVYRRFPNRLYRGFPNPHAVCQANTLGIATASGFGNPRYSRLGSLRYRGVPR
jgi:hypothetical protein